MLGMAVSSTGQLLQNDWVSARATITACEQRALGGMDFSLENYVPPVYVVTFSYAADGQTFNGTYEANSPQECGHDFEVFYDPRHPSRNTASELTSKLWVKWAIAALCVIGVLVWTWICNKERWFQW
jgi:hypothetical protein